MIETLQKRKLHRCPKVKRRSPNQINTSDFLESKGFKVDKDGDEYHTNVPKSVRRHSSHNESFDFENADAFVLWAEKRNIEVRCSGSIIFWPDLSDQEIIQVAKYDFTHE
jgi:hypothetical protein